MRKLIKRRWVIVTKPGCVPVTKKPIGPKKIDAMRLIRELAVANSHDTRLALVELTTGDDLLVSDAREELHFYEVA